MLWTLCKYKPCTVKAWILFIKRPNRSIAGMYHTGVNPPFQSNIRQYVLEVCL